ncbi:MAG: deoxyribose-phosphate aldolase [Clostridia bacterium]|nr:deoxyribose-phosphate aldolase [Clostridia bacterium]
MGLTKEQVAALIDHTLLKPTATVTDIRALCQEAKEYGFYSVCINPCYVKTAADYLRGTDIKVCTVIGFPLGANTMEQKKRETAEAIQNGAGEVDMVINLGAVKAGDWEYVRQDIRGVVEAARGNALVKVILETGLLNSDEITKASLTAKEAGAHFVKTSTGFLGSGASVEAVSLMRKAVGEKLGVKASGGIRNLVQLQEMVAAGATRIGSSSGVAIVLETDDEQ